MNPTRPLSFCFAISVALLMLLASGTSVASAVMVEFYNAELDYFFITSRPAEAAALDTLTGWQRTGLGFTVESEPSATTIPLTRFFFADVARGGTRGSHFYTLSDADRAALHALNPGNASISGKPQDEGTDSYSVAGNAGTCSDSRVPSIDPSKAHRTMSTTAIIALPLM